MKSHALFCRWALVIALGLFLLPATDAAAKKQDEGSSFQLDRSVRVSRVSAAESPGGIVTTDGDPDDVGGGEGKDDDGKRPNPDWERLQEGGASNSDGVIETMWRLLLESSRLLIRF